MTVSLRKGRSSGGGEEGVYGSLRIERDTYGRETDIRRGFGHKQSQKVWLRQGSKVQTTKHTGVKNPEVK
jgi:hypothetical protein